MSYSEYNDILKSLLPLSTKFDEYLLQNNLLGMHKSIDEFNKAYNTILEDGNSGEQKVKILLLLRELTSVMEDVYRKLNKHINKSLSSLILFYNFECDASVSFMQVWRDTKMLFNQIINFIEIDVTIDKNKKFVKDFNLIEYPSIKFVTPSYDIFNYDDELDKKSLQIFLKGKLRQP